MSYVLAAPEMMTSAATDLATIGSDLSGAHAAAAARTVGLIPAAADEVSASIAHLFSQYGAGFQALAGQAAVFHDQFVHNLTASAGSYTSIEAAITAFIQNHAFLQNLNTDFNQVFIAFIEIPAVTKFLGALGRNLFNGAWDVVLFAAYLVAATSTLLRTGQILTWSAYVSNLLSGLDLIGLG